MSVLGGVLEEVEQPPDRRIALRTSRVQGGRFALIAHGDGSCVVVCRLLSELVLIQ